MNRIVFLFVIALFSLSIKAQTNNAHEVTVGNKVPQFFINTQSGDSVSSATFIGKTTLLVFFATWCGPCRLELAEMEPQIWMKYKNIPAFSMWVLGREHSNAEVKDFATNKKYTMPFAGDPERRIFKLFAESQIPRCYLIGKNGTIVYASIGFDNHSIQKLTAAIEADIAK